MADLTVTPSTVLKSSGQERQYTAGEAIENGETVYLKDSDKKLYLADCNVTITEATVKGIALNKAAAANQPVSILEGSGSKINLGAILTVGEFYVQSANAGKIAPVTDLATGHYVSLLGIAETTSILQLLFHNSGVQKP